MSDRCEPAEHLRGVDGWHWVEYQSPRSILTRKSCQQWDHNRHWSQRAMDEPGWRYLAPVAPAALVRELVEALEECADDLEAEISARYSGVRHYECMVQDERRDMAPVEKARAVLHRAKEAGV